MSFHIVLWKHNMVMDGICLLARLLCVQSLIDNLTESLLPADPKTVIAQFFMFFVVMIDLPGYVIVQWLIANTFFFSSGRHPSVRQLEPLAEPSASCFILQLHFIRVFSGVEQSIGIQTGTIIKIHLKPTTSVAEYWNPSWHQNYIRQRSDDVSTFFFSFFFLFFTFTLSTKSISSPIARLRLQINVLFVVCFIFRIN